MSRAAILEAVEHYAPAHVSRLEKLKKGDIASEAERLADETGWMPAIFEVEAPQQNVATDAEPDPRTPPAEALATRSCTDKSPGSDRGASRRVIIFWYDD